jgi:hypothetical protein
VKQLELMGTSSLGGQMTAGKAFEGLNDTGPPAFTLLLPELSQSIGRSQATAARVESGVRTA